LDINILKRGKESKYVKIRIFHPLTSQLIVCCDNSHASPPGSGAGHGFVFLPRFDPSGVMGCELILTTMGACFVNLKLTAIGL